MSDNEMAASDTKKGGSLKRRKENKRNHGLNDGHCL